MTNTLRSPTELRSMFGANLRRLAKSYPSVSELCRQLGINRTQFNRYLSGESFPRPDVLDRICRFFDVDARILLKPLAEVEDVAPPASAVVLEQFLASQGPPALPAGFFRMTEAHPHDRSDVQNRLIHLRHVRQTLLLRGYEPPAARPTDPPALREVQGIMCGTDTHVCALLSRQDGQDCRVMILSEQPDKTAPSWTGHTIYLSRATDEPPVTRTTGLLHLGNDLTAAIGLSRTIRQQTVPTP